MTTLGQLCLLAAFVGSGYATFACLAGWHRADRAVQRSGWAAAVVAVLAVTAATAILGQALVLKDFRFAYVAQYSSRFLPWHYALSAFWVGQAGSLLLWAWLLAVLAMGYRFWPSRQPSPLREPAFGVLMAYLCFLVIQMVFAADPMEPSLSVPKDGAGLGPLLQHPAMLIHPPVVFLGYACWAVPLALALTALFTGRLDAAWPQQVRRWALLAWSVLAVGILLGADWAYEELGWGGYWGWDPVENGSLLPWLTGTALIHASLAWQHRQVLKKTALLLAISTFGLCNFAAFVTRSGLFASMHAFSHSPIGWMFLALMVGLAAGGVGLVVFRRADLRCQKPITSIWTREAVVVVATAALLLLAALVLLGTLLPPLSEIFFGRKITVGTALYSNVLIPIGLLLLAATAVAPLLHWGEPTTVFRRKMLLLAVGGGGIAAAIAFAAGVRHPVGLAVAGLAALAVLALAGALLLDARRRRPEKPWLGLLPALAGSRRRYGGYVIHLGFVCLAVGVTGSSLGTRQHEAVMHEGETVEWAGYSIRYAGLTQRELPEKSVFAAQLAVSRAGAAAFTLLPAQHLHRPQNEWSTEVAIHSTWTRDFYAILHSGKGRERVSLTFIENPLMRWLWLSGWIAAAGVVVALWPAGRRAARQSAAVAPPHFVRLQRRRAVAACLTAAVKKEAPMG